MFTECNGRDRLHFLMSLGLRERILGGLESLEILTGTKSNSANKVSIWK
jgi:hypothetical protein